MLRLDGGETVVGKCLLIATGADYRRLNVEGCQRFEGCGVYYAATPNEAPLCGGAEVVVVGGGNSAGQAVVWLAGLARKVHLLIRGDDLNKNMSSYLVRRIEQNDNIEVHRNTEVRRMYGDDHLTTVEIVNKKTGEERKIQTPAVFSFIGASRAPIGCPRKSRPTSGDLSAPARPWRRPRPKPAGAPHSCWRPAGAACSPPGTCAPARSSASPRPSAKGRWWCNSSMNT